MRDAHDIHTYSGSFLIDSMNFLLRSSMALCLSRTGESGSVGKGGRGGSGAPAGHNVVLEYRQTMYNGMPTDPQYSDPKIREWKQLKDGAVGSDGKDGLNENGIQPAEKLKFVNQTQTISRYKYYVRENLANSIRESGLQKFLAELDEDEIVLSLQDTMGLVDELHDIERHYYRLRSQISFVPFIKRLLSRISNHMQNIESNDELKIAIFLHTATQSKLSSIRSNVNHVSIIDLLDYVDALGQHIEELRNIKNDVKIVEYHAEYKKSMDAKIDFVHTLINDGLIPDVENVIKELEEQIISLINTLTNHENVSSSDTIEETKQKLAHLLQLNRMLEPVKRTNSVLGFLIKLARIMADTVSDTDIIAKIFVHDPNYHEEDRLTAITPSVDTHLDELKDQFKIPYRLFADELIDIGEVLNAYSGEDADVIEIKNKTIETNDTINSSLFDTSLVDPATLESIRMELLDFIANKQPNLKDGKEFNVSQVLNLVGLVDTTVDMYDLVRDNQAQVQQLIASLQTTQTQLEAWKEMERKVYDTLVAELVDVDNIVAIIKQSLEEKLEIDLDIGKWNIQSGLLEAKASFRKMIQNYPTIDIRVQRCVEQVIEGLSVIVDVYDRIESYSVNSKLDAILGRVIANLTVDTNSTNVNDTIKMLKQMIQTNLILEQYEMAMQSIVQHQFPFGDILTKTFALPTDLVYNDTESIAEKAAKQVDDLKDQIKSLQMSMDKYDREIFRNVEFSSSSTSAASPFFVWKNSEIKTELMKLLRGEEITLLADITNGVNQNAVKFKEIGIHFKVQNETIQNELDAELEQFGVSMTQLGHNYYRCGNRFYFISIDDTIVIDYSIKKDPNGKPLKSNEVYQQISSSNYFLSPYATWRIKLTNETSDFDKLKRFQHEIMALELIGSGQYFRDGKSFSHEICNDHLDNYYHYDNTISSLDSIEELSIQVEI